MKKGKQFGVGEPLTDNEAALIYCIIGKNEKGLPPTVEEALAYFDPKAKISSDEKEDELYDNDSILDESEQLTIF